MIDLSRKPTPLQQFHKDSTSKRFGEKSYSPRKRDAMEATSKMVCNASSKQIYRTGDGDVYQAPRLGAMDAYSLPSVGIDAA